MRMSSWRQLWRLKSTDNKATPLPNDVRPLLRSKPLCQNLNGPGSHPSRLRCTSYAPRHVDLRPCMIHRRDVPHVGHKASARTFASLVTGATKV